MTLSEARRWQHSSDPEVRAAAERRLGAQAASRARTAPRRKAGEAAAAKKRLTKKEQRRVVRETCDGRALGTCEHCNGFAPRLHMDHFWGRAREESVESCWMLCPTCDREKTENQPSRSEWIARFRRHCDSWAYSAQVTKCDRALALEAAQHPARASSVRRAEGGRP